ncbi:calcium uniporter protein 3, mitochondrial-like [Manihot esculenta]|uniref:calcium uniporter protein 3, mitochondrial-like n=1 Tax=Manihot esculenta TaxID=3983 RepID=UPI001CC5161A|nr:calcium uniporter protein 3, mitochondrial-like [Manihot esculenta]
MGESLMEKLRSFDIAKSRIRLDGLVPPETNYLDGSRPEREPEKEGDNDIFRRLFHKRALLQTPASPELRSMQMGKSLMEKLRSFDIAKSRIRLDGLVPPETNYLDGSRPKSEPEKEGLSAEDVRKLLWAAQLEMVKSRLREVENSWISYRPQAQPSRFRFEQNPNGTLL